MTDFERDLKSALKAQDPDYISDPIEENGYYRTVFDSLRGKGSGMRITSWIGILVFSGVLLLSVAMFFQAETTRDQILFATLAVLSNSAQIALKLWFNMQLNRSAIIHEIKNLHLAIAKAGD